MIDQPFSHNYKLVIAYEGTLYSGWQIQPNATSIQQLIQEAIGIIIREQVNLIGSGRTDTGVHALGQVAHFKCHREVDMYRFLVSVNGLLPKDIRVLSIEKMDLSFHAQRSTTSKIYHYHLYLGKVQLPFQRLYSFHVVQKVNLHLIEEAIPYFIGTHDFTSFTNEHRSGAAAINPVRTLARLDMRAEEHGVRLEFQAEGFLYKMVRNIVGTLLDVGSGKIAIEEIEAIFDAKDRTKAGRAAPPQGLFLVQVFY